jgi:hypothetical protein
MVGLGGERYPRTVGSNPSINLLAADVKHAVVAAFALAPHHVTAVANLAVAALRSLCRIDRSLAALARQRRAPVAR